MAESYDKGVSPTKSECLENIDFLYNLAEKDWSIQYELADKLDSKAGVAMGFFSTAVVLFLQYYNNIQLDVSPNSAYYVLTLLAFFCSIIFVALAFICRRYHAVDSYVALENYRSNRYVQTKKLLTGDTAHMAQEMTDSNREKAYQLNNSIKFFIIGLVSLVLFVLSR